MVDIKACRVCWKLMKPGDWYEPDSGICKGCSHDRTNARRQEVVAAGTHATCRKCRVLRQVEHLEDKLCWKCRGLRNPCTTVTEKTCTKCKKLLPVSEFYARGSGWRSQCKPCCKHGPRRICQVCGKLKAKTAYGPYRWQSKDRRCAECAPLKRTKIDYDEIREEYESARYGMSESRAMGWLSEKFNLTSDQILKALQ